MQVSVVLRAVPEDLEQLHVALVAFWERVGNSGSAAGAQAVLFDTAVAEIAANIVEHAQFDALPAQFSLTLDLLDDRVEARFVDRARPFEEPSGAVDEDPLSESGRGLALARAAADMVGYERRGDSNHWTVVKRL